MPRSDVTARLRPGIIFKGGVLKRLIASTRAVRVHVLALGLVLVAAHYVPGAAGQAVISAIALILGLPVSEVQAVEKAAEAPVKLDRAAVKAEVVHAADAAETAVIAAISPRSDAAAL